MPPEFRPPESILYKGNITGERHSLGTESYYPLKDGEPLTDRRVKRISIRRTEDKYDSFEQIRTEVEKNLPLLNKYLGKFIPKYQIYYEGKKESDPDSIEPYLVMEEIKKTPCESDEDRKKFFKSLDDYYSTALEMYIQTGVYTDFGNYMYGTTKSKPDSPQIYYFDLYPIADHLDSNPVTLLEIQLQELKYTVRTEVNCDFNPLNFPKTFEKRNNIIKLKNVKL